MEQCTPPIGDNQCVHKWHIWVIVGWDCLDTPTGRVPGVSCFGMIDLANTFYHFYLEKLWIFFLS